MPRQGLWRLLDYITFPTLRGIVGAPMYRRLWMLTGGAYLLISMMLGGMLTFLPSGQRIPFQIWVYWGGAGPSSWFFYPAVLVLHPDFTATLLFGPTVVMIVLGYLVGLSVATGVALVVAFRQRRPDLLASGTAPAVSGWALLGACCCVSCGAQSAAIGMVAAVVGSSPGILIGKLWPLSLAQLAIAWVALAYMESALGRPTARRPSAATGSRARLAVTVVLRLALIIAGVTWLIAFVIEASGAAPLTIALLYHWTFEHVILAGFAFAIALAPFGWRRVMLRGTPPLVLFRISLFVAGATWGIGVPPPLTAYGLGGFLNELVGLFAVPVVAGGVTPDAPVGAALLFHWGLQHLLLSGWAIAFSLWPRKALTALGESSETAIRSLVSGPARRETPGPHPVSAAQGPGTSP